MGIDEIVGWVLRMAGVALALKMAFTIRLYAINTYGLVIHEFDPWFNFRATEYLDNNGWTPFFHWFDHESWYPLGRPVGTTIYPGMQIASVTIKNTLNAIGYEISLNDVCCYVPCWGGVAATFFMWLWAWECSGSANAGVIAALIFSIVPAHIMRSVGGGYDNESVAMTCMMMTFYFWCRSLRNASVDTAKATFDSKFWGVMAGLGYICMAAAWGGYVFVLNMIGVHAGVLVILGKFSPSLFTAYSLFYVIGTLGAMQVPVIGWTPLKSLEQLPCLAALGGLCMLEFCRRVQVDKKLTTFELNKLRLKVGGVAICIGIAIISALAPMGYFGPISSRIRSLFVAHTRTGNPLVDSVAEHQPASSQAYWQYLYYLVYVAPIGFGFTLYPFTEGKVFLWAYASVAYYFSLKMARLIILIGPIGSCLSGVAFGYGLDWALVQMLASESTDAKAVADAAAEAAAAPKPKGGKGKGGKGKGKGKSTTDPFAAAFAFYNSGTGRTARKIGAAAIVVVPALFSLDFYNYCHRLGEAMSNPSIMFQGTMQNGETVMVDDYREAYWWLKKNTPQDSRVMAWWDYGYQIAGIANRTTIADGNTWNHEHIALLGKCLVSPEKDAHRMVRHLADYVLVWTGGGGDDLAKSPHMARISNSVFEGICPNDPTCRNFGFKDNRMTPTDMMAESLLYKLHSNGAPGVKIDPARFEDVFASKFRKVRIFKVKNVDKESKKWNADPKNRICDAPGSWYCEGQYPPKLQPFLKNRKTFAQLEDFNRKKDAKAKKYNEEYMKRMGGH
jgi:dolichyl-diphosphooligosaccharide--protein glycosyltransferase